MGHDWLTAMQRTRLREWGKGAEVEPDDTQEFDPIVDEVLL